MISLIHLSDIHFSGNTASREPSLIVNALRGLNNDYQSIFVVVTGDIAYSGKKEEYKIATEYFDELNKLLKKEISKDIHFVACPGNHDCNFPEDSSDLI